MEPPSKISKVYMQCVNISQNYGKNKNKKRLKLKLKCEKTQPESHIHEKSIKKVQKSYRYQAHLNLVQISPNYPV